MDNVILTQKDVELFVLHQDAFEADDFLFVDIEDTHKFEGEGVNVMRLILRRDADDELFAGEYLFDNFDNIAHKFSTSFYHVKPVARIMPTVEYYSETEFKDRVNRQQRIEPSIVSQFVTGSAEVGMIVDDWQFLDIAEEEHSTVEGRTLARLWLNRVSTHDMFGSEPFVMFPAESRTIPEYFTGLGGSFKD